MVDFTELKVCSDCLSAIANDDYSGLDDSREREVRAAIARHHWLVAGTEEYGFSWTPCDVCQSSLGGDRHQAYEEREI